MAVLDSGICRNMKAPVGDMDTRGGGNASSMGVVGLTGQHWRAERKGQLAVNSKLPDFREQSDLPPSRGLAANTDSYSFFFFFLIYFWLCLGLHCCGGFSLWRFLSLQKTGSWAHGLQ